METTLEIYNEDINKWSKEYSGPPFHALFTDCPYEYGFMGKSWDSSGVSFLPDTWAALGKHLLPGAFGMTYGGARTWHRIATAIEDAGFIIHPSIFCWAYATGLHKAARIDTAIDKEKGVYDEREVLEKSTATYGYQRSGERWNKDHFVTRPASKEALAWWEYRYGIQALRPAVEPIILFQKPYEGKKVDSIREYGSGALHIEACKYEGGKWPTNVVISHHPLCTKAKCHPTCNLHNGNFDNAYFPTFSWGPDFLEGVNLYYNKKSLGPEREIELGGINHPTIKPISLNVWLAKLLLPPGVYSPRRLLVPFGGVMSESIGAILAGWEHIVSVEKTHEYANAGRNRAEWWMQMANKYGNDVDEILKASAIDDGMAEQLTFST